MNNWEEDYLYHMYDIYTYGKETKGRNGMTRSTFGKQLVVDSLNFGKFPLLTTRKMFLNGIKGEYAAIVRGPQSVSDFTKWGCNYWGKWADADGSLRVDYGNAWHIGDQFNNVIKDLRDNPSSRRMLIDAWVPENQDTLSLPCCHYSYQFYFNGDSVDMIFNQRSADWCVGVPSDVAFAAIMLLDISAKAGRKAGTIIMNFGDTHLYEEHFDNVNIHYKRKPLISPDFTFEPEVNSSFIPNNLEILNYNHLDKLNYELKD